MVTKAEFEIGELIHCLHHRDCFPSAQWALSNPLSENARRSPYLRDSAGIGLNFLYRNAFRSAFKSTGFPHSTSASHSRFHSS
jgi:hypothetical protein